MEWGTRGTSLCHPKNNIGKYTKLQVSEAQEVVIIVNGERSQKFGCGTHNLDSPNMPILSRLYGLPYGGENPWVVQAWFVNKTMPMNIDWETNAFTIYDESFGAAIPIFAKGKYGITVVDAERLVFKLALGYPVEGKKGITVTSEDFTEQLYGELMIHTKSILTRVMAANKISITAINAHLTDISSNIESQINTFFEEFGCKLLKLYVTSVDVDESTEDGRMIKQSISQQTMQKISGYTWQQEKMFNTVDNALTGFSNSNSGGILGAVMAVNMMGGNGMMGGNNMMNPAPNQPGCAPVNPNSTDSIAEIQKRPIKDVYCSECSKKFSSEMKFCPHCGDIYNPCPKCGSDNNINATRCVSCGMSLTPKNVLICGGCNQIVDNGLRFCPHCGRPTSNDKSCPRCNSTVTGAAFCPTCGYKIQ